MNIKPHTLAIQTLRRLGQAHDALVTVRHAASLMTIVDSRDVDDCLQGMLQDIEVVRRVLAEVRDRGRPSEPSEQAGGQP